MNFFKAITTLLLTLALLGCAKPIPPERAAYIGEWRGTDMLLFISKEGNVSYRRKEGNASRSIDAPLQEFQGDNFVVGLGLMSTTFVVSSPPHQDGETWKMTVDGVELSRQ